MVDKLALLKKALVEESPMDYMVKEYSTFEVYREATFDWCGKRTTRPVNGQIVDFHDPELDLELDLEEIDGFIKTL